MVRLVAFLAVLAACDSGSPPDIQGLSDQTVAVGQELQLSIDGTDPESAAIDASLAPLHQNVQWVEDGTITRSILGERFSHYVIPSSVVAGDLDRALRVPKFNEVISPAILFWPQARARWDAERMCLVSIESPARPCPAMRWCQSTRSAAPTSTFLGSHPRRAHVPP